jgi:hypothetical protein
MRFAETSAFTGDAPPRRRIEVERFFPHRRVNRVARLPHVFLRDLQLDDLIVRSSAPSGEAGRAPGTDKYVDSSIALASNWPSRGRKLS